MATPSNALLSALRQHTGPLHQRLDSHPLLEPLRAPGNDPDRYRQALTGLATGWIALESGLERDLSEPFKARFFLARRHALREDLAELNTTLPGIESLPALSTAESLGVLYVLLGAQMGAGHIDKQLARHRPDWPRRFFQCRFADLGQVWQAFMAALEGRDEDSEEAVQGAIRAFETILAAVDDTTGKALSPESLSP